MKILYVLDIYPVLSETFIRDEIKELREQGHEVIISCFTLGEDIDRIPSDLKPDVVLNDYKISISWTMIKAILKIKNTTFSFEQKNIPLKEIIFHSLKIEKLAKINKVDRIHAHFGLNASAFAIQASKFSNIPCSFTLHGYDVNKANIDMVAKLKFVNNVISVSDFLKDETIKKNNLPNYLSKKIKVIPFGVKTRNQKITKIKTNEYLFVGRFNKVKGIEHMLKIWEKDRTLSLLNLIGFGTDEEEKFLKNEIKNKKLNVRILGKRNSPQIFEAMSSHKAIILPFKINKKTGERDTGAIVAKEAMLNEIPIITTDLIDHIVTENEAFIAKSDNEDSLYEKILNFENSKIELISEKTKKAKEKVLSEFTIERQVKEFIKCIQ